MSFTELPLELQTDVLAELDDASLEVAACVCRAFHRVAPAIWRRRLGTRFATSRWAHVGSEGTSARTMLRKMQALQHTEWDSMRATGCPPADRGGHASTMLGQGQWIVIHGGANGDVLHGDGFALSCAGREWTWHRLRDERAPCPRWAHTAAPWGSIALFFGGHAGSGGALNDVRALDAANSADPCDWVWRAPEEIECSGAAPEPRYGHAMCEHADAIWVFGGIVGEVRFATWRLTPAEPAVPTQTTRRPTRRARAHVARARGRRCRRSNRSARPTFTWAASRSARRRAAPSPSHGRVRVRRVRRRSRGLATRSCPLRARSGRLAGVSRRARDAIWSVGDPRCDLEMRSGRLAGVSRRAPHSTTRRRSEMRPRAPPLQTLKLYAVACV